METGVTKRGRLWVIPAPERDACVNNERSYKTKREAVAAMQKFQERAEYERKLIEQDASGVWDWTDADRAEIEKLTQALRDNYCEVQNWKPEDFRTRVRAGHKSDVRCIESWEANTQPLSQHGRVVCAELRRRMAARAIAFERAGLSIETPAEIVSTEAEWKLCKAADDDSDAKTFFCVCGRCVEYRHGHDRIGGRRCLDCSAKLDAFLFAEASRRAA